MNKIWKIVTLLGVIALTCAAYAWGIPAAINIEARKSSIEKIIQQNSGYKIDIGKPKLSMGFFPSIWLKTDNISIINPDDSKALSIDNPKLKLKLFPLIWKKIEISKLSADKEEVYLTFTKDSQFLLGQYPITKQKSSDFTITRMDLNLGEYGIYLDDQLNNKKASLCGDYFDHGKYIQNKHVKFATKSVLTVGDKSTDINTDVQISLPIDRLSEDQFKIDADIKDFDLSSVSDYVKILTGEKIKKISGNLNINAKTTPDRFGHKNISAMIRTEKLSVIGKDKVSTIVYDDELNANINFGTVENGIDFKNTTLESKNIHAKVDGKIYNLGNKSPKYNIEAEVQNTRLEDVVSILPWDENLLKDFNLYKLKESVFYGDGEGKVKFVGQGNRPDVTGEIRLSNAYLNHPIKYSTANADINLKFLGKKMLLDVEVPASYDQWVKVRGTVLIDGSKYSELEIKSSDSVLLAPAQEILNPLHEILKFQLGPVPMMKISSGVGNINMRSAGKKIDPHIWGDISFKNSTVSLNDIHNLLLTNGNGNVHFGDTQITFGTKSAFVNGLPIEIKGDCSVLGKLNVYVTSKGQDIQKLVNVINTSPILVDVQKVVKPFTNPQGKADVFLHIYGTAKNAEQVVFNQDLFSRGTITLHDAKTVMQDTFLPFTKINGKVNFDQYTSDYDVTGFVRGSKAHVVGTGSDSQIDLKAYSDKFALADVFDLLHPDMILPYKKDIGKIDVSFTGGYKGTADANMLDYSKVVVDGKFFPNMDSNNPIKLDGGSFSIKKGVLSTSNLKGLFNNNPYTLTFTSKDIYNEEMNISDAKFNFKEFDLNAINTIKNQIKLPKEISGLIGEITDIRGKVDIAGTIKNNKITADTNLKDTGFTYKPFDARVRVLNGLAKVRGDVLYLDKVNSRVSSMPVFLDGKVSDIYHKPNLNLAISSKLTQQFFDIFYNTKSVYPVKTKGNINLYSQVRGSLDELRLKSTLNLSENSSIYYMGATIAGAPTGALNTEDGSISTNPVSIYTDTILYPNKIKLNSLKYDQTITSQNKKKSVQNQLNASGELRLLENNVIGFNNFKVKTEEPTNARIFNILFKKPTIKQGVFTTDMTINGTSSAPYILGFLNVKSVDIPLLNSTVRDVNANFASDYIDVIAKANVMTNDILIKTKILNNPQLPYLVDDLNVEMDALDLNILTTAFNDFDADNTRSRVKSDNVQIINPGMLLIKNGQINADKVLIKKANATNFRSHLVLGEDQVLKIDDFKFNIANGDVSGQASYDLKTSTISGGMKINNADAQIIAENFFDMNGQMFGTVTGELSAQCTGMNSIECINSLSGEGKFEVADGRMPKLGSLEYLLKAGNLITGGITGVSINGIIDLITPLKTGNFKSINGTIHVQDGVADDINVYSSGEDLNMYMTGKYNISTLVADMEVYGSLSKNFSTILGRIANSSLNTLFNTIPGININEINPKSTSNINKIPNFDKSNILRVFKADIYGDINGNNYVKSFKWIKD